MNLNTDNGLDIFVDITSGVFESARIGIIYVDCFSLGEPHQSDAATKGSSTKDSERTSSKRGRHSVSHRGNNTTWKGKEYRNGHGNFKETQYGERFVVVQDVRPRLEPEQN